MSLNLPVQRSAEARFGIARPCDPAALICVRVTWLSSRFPFINAPCILSPDFAQRVNIWPEHPFALDFYTFANVARDLSFLGLNAAWPLNYM